MHLKYTRPANDDILYKYKYICTKQVLAISDYTIVLRYGVKKMSEANQVVGQSICSASYYTRSRMIKKKLAYRQADGPFKNSSLAK